MNHDQKRRRVHSPLSAKHDAVEQPSASKDRDAPHTAIKGTGPANMMASTVGHALGDSLDDALAPRLTACYECRFKHCECLLLTPQDYANHYVDQHAPQRLPSFHCMFPRECPERGYSWNKSKFRGHIVAHHLPKPTSTSVIHCPENCGQVFVNRMAFDVHLQLVHDIYNVQDHLEKKIREMRVAQLEQSAVSRGCDFEADSLDSMGVDGPDCTISAANEQTEDLKLPNPSEEQPEESPVAKARPDGLPKLVKAKAPIVRDREHHKETAKCAICRQKMRSLARTCIRCQRPVHRACSSSKGVLWQCKACREVTADISRSSFSLQAALPEDFSLQVVDGVLQADIAHPRDYSKWSFGNLNP